MSLVSLEKKQKIAIITINRPESLNALNNQVWCELTDAWTNVKDDPDVWTIVLTGAGDKAFCDGQDLKEMAQLREAAVREKRAFVSAMPEIICLIGFCF